MLIHLLFRKTMADKILIHGLLKRQTMIEVGTMGLGEDLQPAIRKNFSDPTVSRMMESVQYLFQGTANGSICVFIDLENDGRQHLSYSVGNAFDQGPYMGDTFPPNVSILIHR